ncbi:MAG: response regulator transcription factor [Eubacterium sp.]
MIKILIAEDDKAMRKILSLYFEREGWQVKCAPDGSEALKWLEQEPFDLAVLDWMMPGASGPEICSTIKEWALPVKTILLTAKGQNQDEIEGLESGADDYLRKPFEPKVLLLRIRKLLEADRIVKCGALALNLRTWKAQKAGIPLDLNKKETELLAYFLRNQDRILTREILLDRLWGMDYEGEERTVDTHIKRLRAKIGHEMIKTKRGVGYVMERCDESDC